MNTCYCDKPTLYLRKQGLNSRAFANLWVFFIFFCRLTGEYSWCFKHDSNKTLIQMNKTDVAYSLQQNFESKVRFKMPQKNCYFEIFVSSIYVKGCLGWKISPPKNLEKIRRPKYACAKFFLFVLLKWYFSNLV